jgi:hypothetical protein
VAVSFRFISLFDDSRISEKPFELILETSLHTRVLAERAGPDLHTYTMQITTKLTLTRPVNELTYGRVRSLAWAWLGPRWLTTASNCSGLRDAEIRDTSATVAANDSSCRVGFV